MGVPGVQETSKNDYKEEIMGCFERHLLDWQFFSSTPYHQEHNCQQNKSELIVCESCMYVLVISVVVYCNYFVGALKSSLKAKGYPTLNKMSNQMKSNMYRPSIHTRNSHSLL